MPLAASGLKSGQKLQPSLCSFLIEDYLSYNILKLSGLPLLQSWSSNNNHDKHTKHDNATPLQPSIEAESVHSTKIEEPASTVGHVLAEDIIFKADSQGGVKSG
jgi:hypothetical protein